MTQSALEKQEAKLKQLNQKIKDLAQKIATVLNHESNNQL
jgi:hypothetical protein